MRNCAHVCKWELLWSLLSGASKNEPTSLLSVKLRGPDAEGVDTAQAALPVQGDVIPLGLTPVQLGFLCQLLSICSCLASTLVGFHQPYLTLGYMYSSWFTILITFQLPIKSKKVARIKGRKHSGGRGCDHPRVRTQQGALLSCFLVRLREQMSVPIWLTLSEWWSYCTRSTEWWENTNQTQTVMRHERKKYCAHRMHFFSARSIWWWRNGLTLN